MRNTEEEEPSAKAPPYFLPSIGMMMLSMPSTSPTPSTSPPKSSSFLAGLVTTRRGLAAAAQPGMSTATAASGAAAAVALASLPLPHMNTKFSQNQKDKISSGLASRWSLRAPIRSISRKSPSTPTPAPPQPSTQAVVAAAAAPSAAAIAAKNPATIWCHGWTRLLVAMACRWGQRQRNIGLSRVAGALRDSVTRCSTSASLLILTAVCGLAKPVRRQATAAAAATAATAAPSASSLKAVKSSVSNLDALGDTIASTSSTSDQNNSSFSKFIRECDVGTHGEDAWFVLNRSNSTESPILAALGVADGVGGYVRFGQENGSAAMARSLMSNSLEDLHDSAQRKTKTVDARQIIASAYESVKERKQVVCGGSTACVVMISQHEQDDDKLLLQAGNLGDSGFIVIRGHRVLYRTRDQTHSFNTPYQLSIAPSSVSGSIGGGGALPPQTQLIQDSPLAAELIGYDEPIELQDDDIVILGTDGIFDNLFSGEIISAITSVRNQLYDEYWTEQYDLSVYCERIAREITQRATAASRQKSKATPFSEYAKQHNYKFNGGKVDDITCVVALVARRERFEKGSEAVPHGNKQRKQQHTQRR